MKNKFYKLAVLALTCCLLLMGCSENDPVQRSNGYEQLVDYLRAENLGPEEILDANGVQPLLLEPPSDGNLSDNWILDIRHAVDFANGHISDATSAGFKDILTAASAADKPILVVGYTGEVAAYVAALLRLYGYNDAQALKWGMSGWHEDFDLWTDNLQDVTDHENWTFETFNAEEYNTPNFNTTASNGAELLKKRVENTFAAGYKSTDASAVMANPSAYYVNFLMPESHYLGFGHVEGAVQVFPINFENLDRLNPQEKLVICSYSGHTSAVITAILNVLGFEATNLKFGMNSLASESAFWNNGNIAGHWGGNVQPKNLPYVSEN